MRNKFLVITVSALALFAIILYLYNFIEKKEPEYISFIPHDAAGVVIVRNLPESIESLQATRLGEWIDFESAAGSGSPTKEQFRKAAEFYRENASHMLLCLHSIQKKENGSLRPELTIFLRPFLGRTGALAEEIKKFVVSRFGEDRSKTEQIKNTTIIRGPEAGQVFYLELCDGYIAASNSEEAWNQLQAVKNMAGGKRLMPSWYPIMMEEQSADIYFYFKGVAGWAPRFVYSISITGNGLTDSYREF